MGIIAADSNGKTFAYVRPLKFYKKIRPLKMGNKHKLTILQNVLDLLEVGVLFKWNLNELKSSYYFFVKGNSKREIYFCWIVLYCFTGSNSFFSIIMMRSNRSSVNC